MTRTSIRIMDLKLPEAQNYSSLSCHEKRVEILDIFEDGKRGFTYEEDLSRKGEVEQVLWGETLLVERRSPASHPGYSSDWHWRGWWPQQLVWELAEAERSWEKKFWVCEIDRNLWRNRFSESLLREARPGYSGCCQPAKPNKPSSDAVNVRTWPKRTSVDIWISTAWRRN